MCWEARPNSNRSRARRETPRLIAGGILAVGGQGNHSAADEVGLGLMLAGLASKIVSSATTPEADTRMWDNLPNSLSIAMLKLPPGKHTAIVQFKNDSGLGPASLRRPSISPSNPAAIKSSSSATNPARHKNSNFKTEQENI